MGSVVNAQSVGPPSGPNLWKRLGNSVMLMVDSWVLNVSNAIFGNTTTTDAVIENDLTVGNDVDIGNDLTVGNDGYFGNNLWVEEIASSSEVVTNIIKLVTDFTPLTEEEAWIWWNSDELAVNIATGIGPVLQVGQEIYVLVFNDTGEGFDNCTLIRPTGIQMVGGIAIGEFSKTQADSFETAQGTIVMATMPIPNGTVGLATRFGKVRGCNTTGLTPGIDLFMASTTPGLVTNDRPEFPWYAITVGAVLVVDGSEGVIQISITKTVEDTFDSFYIGNFREKFDWTIACDGSDIIGSLEPANGHPDMTGIWSDGFDIFPTTPAATLTLTAGTDTVTQTNYTYIPESNRQLTVSTVDWPAEEHIKVATNELFSSDVTCDYGPDTNQNHNNFIQDTDDLSQLSRILQRFRKEDAAWESGIEAVVTIDSGPSPDDIELSVTAGDAYQIGIQDIPAMDMALGDVAWVVNDFVTPNSTTSNMNTLTTDATGITLSNSSFSIVSYRIINKSGTFAPVKLNLPVCSYSRLQPEKAIADADNCSVYTVPGQYTGKAIYMKRFTFTLDATGNIWTLEDSEDLVNLPINGVRGGGGGGTGIETYLALTDVFESSYGGFAGYLSQVNSLETGLEFTNDLNMNSVTTTDHLFIGSYASSSIGFFTPGDIHAGGMLSVDSNFTVGSVPTMSVNPTTPVITMNYDSGNLGSKIEFNDNGTTILRLTSQFQTTTMNPLADVTHDIGSINGRYVDLHLSGDITDDTNSITMGDPIVFSGGITAQRATTTDTLATGRLGLNSEYWSDLSGTNLENDGGRLDVVDNPSFAGNITMNDNNILDIGDLGTSGDRVQAIYADVIDGIQLNVTYATTTGLWLGSETNISDIPIVFKNTAGNGVLTWNVDGSGFDFDNDLTVTGSVTSTGHIAALGGNSDQWNLGFAHISTDGSSHFLPINLLIS